MLQPSDVGIESLFDYFRELMKIYPDFEEDELKTFNGYPYVGFTRKEKADPSTSCHTKSIILDGTKIHYNEDFYVTIMFVPFQPCTNGGKVTSCVIELCDPNSLKQLKNIV